MPGIVKGLIAAVAVVLVAALLVPYGLRLARRIHVGGVAIDPAAQVRRDREYTVVVWDHEVPLPWSPGAHRQALEAVVEELAGVHPNLTVEVEWLPWEAGVETVLEALAAGEGPDIYGLHGGGALLAPARQVPVDPYLTDDSRADWLPSAMRALSDGNRIWAWPRWIAPARWIGDARRMEDTPIAGGFPTHEGALQTFEALKASGARGVALAAHDPHLFYDLMVALTGHAMLAETGDIAWTEEALRTAAAFLEALRDRGLLTADPDTMSRNRLRAFTSGNALVLAPANPWTTHFLLGRAGALARDEDSQDLDWRTAGGIVLFAPPAPDEHAGVAASVSAYTVFRRSPHAGDDHTRMVMQVAETLSRRMGLWEATHLLTVPAHPSSVSDWRRTSGLSAPHADYLLEAAERAVGPPLAIEHARYQAEALERIFVPAVQALLTGALDAETFAASVLHDLQGLRAERYVP